MLINIYDNIFGEDCRVFDIGDDFDFARLSLRMIVTSPGYT